MSEDFEIVERPQAKKRGPEPSDLTLAVIESATNGRAVQLATKKAAEQARRAAHLFAKRNGHVLRMRVRGCVVWAEQKPESEK